MAGFYSAVDRHSLKTMVSAVGYNLRLILKWLRKLFRKIIAAIWEAMIPPSALKPAS